MFPNILLLLTITTSDLADSTYYCDKTFIGELELVRESDI